MKSPDEESINSSGSKLDPTKYWLNPAALNTGSEQISDKHGSPSYDSLLSITDRRSLYSLLPPLILHSDMNEEMQIEAMDLCVTACEKFSNNNETAAKQIKETLDKKFGASWHVVVGEGFGFEVTHEVKNLLYMFFGGSQAIILWKCS